MSETISQYSSQNGVAHLLASSFPFYIQYILKRNKFIKITSKSSKITRKKHFFGIGGNQSGSMEGRVKDCTVIIHLTNRK